MKLQVEKKQRYAKMRAHTATHLLHAQLDKILWTTKQSWSFVDEDYFRLDFTTDKPLDSKQILQIEKNVNQIIYWAYDVIKEEMNINDAINKWAKAFFEDKYWDVVRTIKIWEDISFELCWWTHVENTREIWIFKIIWQEAVASWIRRIVWTTWPKVFDYIIEKNNVIHEIWTKLDSSEKQLLDKVDKIIKELETVQSENESFRSIVMKNYIKEIIRKSNNSNFEYVVNITTDSNLNSFNFKDITNYIKSKYRQNSIIVTKHDWTYFLKTENAKETLKNYQIKWWWNNEQAQWKDPKILEIIS